MEYKIKAYTILEPGQRKDSYGEALQEDAIFPAHGQEGGDDRLFVVCDGMGGRNAGDIASTTVCSTISKAVAAAHGDMSANTVAQAVTSAYDALDALDPAMGQKMGTTLAMLMLGADGYVMAHMGDSRIYHIRPGRTADQTQIVSVTLDHTLVNYLVKKGEMSPEEARVSDKRNVITRALQPNMARRCRPDVYSSSDVRAGDYFLVCSDGLLENINDGNLRSVFSAEGGSDKNKVALLRQASVNNADNVSAIIVHILDVIVASQPESYVAQPEPVMAQPTHFVATKQPDVDATGPDATPQTNTKEMKPKISKATKNVSRKAQEIVDKYGKGDGPAFFIKVLVGLMVVLTVIMLVYNLFVRTDETLQAAGTAIETPLNNPDEDTYGYEITEQDVRNEAQQVAPEFEENTVDDEVPEVIDDQVVPIEQPESVASEPQPAPSDEPQLME